MKGSWSGRLFCHNWQIKNRVDLEVNSPNAEPGMPKRTRPQGLDVHESIGFFTRHRTALGAVKGNGVRDCYSSCRSTLKDLKRSAAGRAVRLCRLIIASLVLLLPLSKTADAERLPMRLYTTADGLWSSFINYMMRDSHGFIWLCTRDGLSRFDGYRFVNYKIADAPASQNFFHMYESRDGVFWIFINGDGLYRYDPAAITVSGRAAPAAASDDGKVPLHAERVSTRFFGEVFEDRK